MGDNEQSVSHDSQCRQTAPWPVPLIATKQVFIFVSSEPSDWELWSGSAYSVFEDTCSDRDHHLAREEKHKEHSHCGIKRVSILWPSRRKLFLRTTRVIQVTLRKEDLKRFPEIVTNRKLFKR